MIEELRWDTEFFGKRIGRLTAVPPSLRALLAAIGHARRAGYKYLHCRLDGGRPADARLLEAAGFYMTDIGVSWDRATARHDNESYAAAAVAARGKVDIRIATVTDIPHLKTLCRGLFKESRFYHDPFFRRDADGFYAAWIENSVKGEAANRVFFIKGAGFVAVKKISRTVGEMPLIGVVKAKQGKGYGMALISAAMGWFRDMKIKTVRTRTQLRNIQAMNFYHSAGFRIAGADVVMGRAL